MNETVSMYRPSRVDRRKAAGQHCRMCGTRLHHLDVVALVPPGGSPVHVHVQCAGLLAEQAANEAAASAEEENAEAAAQAEQSSTPEDTITDEVTE